MSTNGVNGASTNTPEYIPSSRYHSQPETLRVIHVGAGAAGLIVAYKLQKQLQKFELVCYEKCVNYDRPNSIFGV